jgi:hypothetical protein
MVLPARTIYMQLSRLSFALALIVPLAGACTDDSTTDELAADDATVGEDSKADFAGGVYTYYFVTPDFRRCASPFCGGVFYRLANATKTTCADGRLAGAHRAYQIDVSEAEHDRLGYGKTRRPPKGGRPERTGRVPLVSRRWLRRGGSSA